MFEIFIFKSLADNYGCRTAKYDIKYDILTFLRPRTNMEPAASDLPSLLNIDIETTSEGLATARFTSVDLVKAYLGRIEEASCFKAVLQVNPDALFAAQLLSDIGYISFLCLSLHFV
jgi:hypothetical protein